MANELVDLNTTQTSPYQAKAEDFKFSGKKGEIEGEGKNERAGGAAESSPTLARGGDFKATENDGETGTKVDSNVYVCLETGEHESYVTRDKHMTDQVGV
jgi:hypothetical protein